MTTKTIAIIGAAIFIAGGGVFLLSQGKKDQPLSQEQTAANNEQARNQAKEIIKKADQADTGIIVPENLLDCPAEYFEKAPGGSMKVDCSALPKEPTCSYYKTVKNGVEKYHNLEFTNACLVCRNHKLKGEQFNDNNGEIYIHLGFENKACTQGMYKTR
jgi:hypothetical protein